MMRSGNIFEREGGRGNGMRTVSGVTIAVIICSLLSGIAAIGIILNFEAVTARIAVFVGQALSSRFLLL